MATLGRPWRVLVAAPADPNRRSLLDPLKHEPGVSVERLAADPQWFENPAGDR